ncbi:MULTISPECIES: UDP-N-acetylglucosamine 1-carboxyvinyltransferase [unclassified Arthrobacter]|uniref:UDP-N-acetylglucosamine 1-carboxyvinyltransferase n=1 Tax=unclassified Arthrobacter TaxID=235627 RepID=UPI001E333360|nr:MULTISPECIES: UDP-N-acetylglucosamine 1-carboxyvinyltransferase [unclassified Arthrobacter]MCC9146561.1 UDP-N-acetylglucosamine 1-carboxyvinyltransferase [Arthrobacter sp. zg-Y919]MDK1277791.1 UDP-N-acetylglucosamine 1-carboxyvinyltransferase [Arthrobacter sp. zg.Y919]WIB02254.1 UDP-N-acetylglucosamine 1-carboxyvinyltransferase [Arthrobacter sp. zg-Y919]
MEDVIVVTGPSTLNGAVTVPGAKNSVLKLMAATLLARGRSVITNVPNIQDVWIMAELLRRLGCTVDYDVDAASVSVDVPQEPGHQADYDLVRAMRASISVLGPLVARCRRAEVALPGGDAIGSRGLDMHRAGLELMGAEIGIDHGYLIASVPEGLYGAEHILDFPSVGATENLMMAATLARGRTVIDNAAREPEITDIARMLNGMGAKISGVGTSTLVIDGVPELHPVEHRVVPDRIVAGTWAFAAAITGGEIEVRSADASALTVVLDKLVQAGCEISTGEDSFTVKGPQRPEPINVSTLPYPGFPTDLQPFVVALNAVSAGSGMVTENVFEARWGFTSELARLGAVVRLDGHHALIQGVQLLSGAPVVANDIRAGAALVIAGLAADGTTEVRGVDHIDRGYERFMENLRGLGANVVRRRA